MKKLLFLLLISLNLFGVTKTEIYNFYKNQNYKDTCSKGMWILNKNRNDNYMSIVSLSCVKSDMINSAIRISKLMGKTKIGRANASYVANLYLIKKLLIQFVYDKINLSNLSLPKSNHLLSKVFENI